MKKDLAPSAATSHQRPQRPGRHNIPAPAVSVIVAVLIGGIETLGRIIDTFKLEGPFWEMIGSLNDNFGALRCGIYASSR
jgi:nickel/cobalt transporter (NiCoT) family protein